MASDENDPDERRWYSGFTQGLSELGWMDGRNVHIDVRWEGESIDRLQIFAKELVEMQPDVILSTSTLATAAVQRETRTVGFNTRTAAQTKRAPLKITSRATPNLSVGCHAQIKAPATIIIHK
jgi:hypothetical protein